MIPKARPKPPTKTEQIEALQAEIEDLKQRLDDVYRRAVTAETDVRNSDPYKALQRQNEELLEVIRLQGVQKNEKQTEHVPGNPKRGRPRKASPEMVERVRSLRKDGASIRTISAAVGLSVGSVASLVRSMAAESDPAGK